ncbi:MAG: hypothetical protein RL607_1912 [Bacteroidota bacterium]|jgi:plasmid maintenance system antidote protein VapI
MNTQELLFKALRKKIGNRSLHDTLVESLGISYDAAHRRVSGKSKLSMDEALQLSKAFGISLDQLEQNQNHLICKKSTAVTSQTELAAYLENAYTHLAEFKNQVTFYYSAKDIPLFYTLGSNLLSKFKWYVWLNLLAKPEDNKAFDQFYLEQSIADYTQKLENLYRQSTVHELWNDSTLNSTLYQIDYYYEAGLLTAHHAQELLENLVTLIDHLEQKVNDNPNFFLYYHELLLMNNNVLVQSEQQAKLFVPYTMISYLITDDLYTTQESVVYFQRQLGNAKCLNASGPKDRLQFFAKNRQRIQYVLDKIKNSIEFK